MKNKLFIAIIFVLMLSCKSKKESLVLSYHETADGWLNRPKNESEEFYNSPELNIKLDIPIVFIDLDKLNDAIILLKDVFYIKLTDDEYKYFTGKNKTESNAAYLIRSVNYSFNEYGYFFYKFENNNLLISHKVLGSGKEKGIQKWPIIILYDDLETINEIYTIYSVAK